MGKIEIGLSCRYKMNFLYNFGEMNDVYHSLYRDWNYFDWRRSLLELSQTHACVDSSRISIDEPTGHSFPNFLVVIAYSAETFHSTHLFVQTLHIMKSGYLYLSHIGDNRFQSVEQSLKNIFFLPFMILYEILSLDNRDDDDDEWYLHASPRTWNFHVRFEESPYKTSNCWILSRWTFTIFSSHFYHRPFSSFLWFSLAHC